MAVLFTIGDESPEFVDDAAVADVAVIVVAVLWLPCADPLTQITCDADRPPAIEERDGATVGVPFAERELLLCWLLYGDEFPLLLFVLLLLLLLLRSR